MIWLPTVDQVIRAHERLIERTGGSMGTRDAGLIESAIMRAHAGFGDQELYPTVAEKAAAVGLGLVCNHGFIDGNKRIGILMLLLILAQNGVRLQYTQRELIDLGLEAAQNHHATDSVARWIDVHTVR